MSEQQLEQGRRRGHEVLVIDGRLAELDASMRELAVEGVG